MRVDIVLISTFVLVPSLVFAADYNVPEGGTLAKAIAEANANKDGDMYEIEISGTSADSGNVKNSAAIVGNPSAVLSGSLAFNGTGVRSEISNLVFYVRDCRCSCQRDFGVGRSAGFDDNFRRL